MDSCVCVFGSCQELANHDVPHLDTMECICDEGFAHERMFMIVDSCTIPALIVQWTLRVSIGMQFVLGIMVVKDIIAHLKKTEEGAMAMRNLRRSTVACWVWSTVAEIVLVFDDGLEFSAAVNFALLMLGVCYMSNVGFLYNLSKRGDLISVNDAKQLNKMTLFLSRKLPLFGTAINILFSVLAWHFKLNGNIKGFNQMQLLVYMISLIVASFGLYKVLYAHFDMENRLRRLLESGRVISGGKATNLSMKGNRDTMMLSKYENLAIRYRKNRYRIVLVQLIMGPVNLVPVIFYFVWGKGIFFYIWVLSMITLFPIVTMIVTLTLNPKRQTVFPMPSLVSSKSNHTSPAWGPGSSFSSHVNQT